MMAAMNQEKLRILEWMFVEYGDITKPLAYFGLVTSMEQHQHCPKLSCQEI